MKHKCLSASISNVVDTLYTIKPHKISSVKNHQRILLTFHPYPPSIRPINSQCTLCAVVVLLCTSALMLVTAEPPPSANYLPPQQQHQQQPSNQYGAPAPSQQYGAPSNSYVPPPTNSYIPPQQQQQQQKPSASYGAPSQTSAVYQAPPQQPQSSYGAPAPQQGGGPYGGGANDYESNGEPARYNFQYDVQDYQSGNDFGHMEQRDGDLTTGRYYVLLPDGRKQIVTYEADRNGYRPTITYEQTNQGAAGGNNGYNGNAQPSGQFNGY